MLQEYDNGKYTVFFNERTGAMHALRNGEKWRDLCGDKLIYQMLVEHKQALEQRAELLEALKGMKDAFCNPESGEMDKRLAVQDMNIAITKAEEAE